MMIIMKRKLITLFYQPKVGHCTTKVIRIDEEFHSPKCLFAIAQALKALDEEFVLLTSEKYGCRQFTP